LGARIVAVERPDKRRTSPHRQGTLRTTDGIAHRLAFVKVTGGRVDVPLEDIIRVRLDKAFLSSVVGGRTHVIVKTRAGDEVGFFAQDHEEWKRALEHAVEAKGA
jgi:hypothetical protein